MVDYVQNNSKDNLGLNEIAESTSISVREYLRCFKDKIGIFTK